MRFFRSMHQEKIKMLPAFALASVLIMLSEIRGESVKTKLETQSEIQSVTIKNYPSSCDSAVKWSDKNCQVGPVSIGTDIAPHVFRQLCPRATGRYEAPSSCDLYIVCHGERLTVNRCQTSNHFSPTVQKCVDAQLYECSHPLRDALSVLNQTTTGNAANRDKRSLILPEENIMSSISKVGFEKSHLVKRSIKSNGNCPEDYIRPHPGSCDKFLICSNGKFFEQSCGVGAKFNPLSRVCDQPDNVDCTSRITDLGTYDCQPNYVYITSHFEFCNKFIECDHGELYVKTCPSNTVFDAEASRCGHAYNTPCDKPISLEHDTDVNYVRIPRDVSKYVCEFNYIAPIEGVCNEFLECEDSRLYRKSCGPGTAYNVLLGQCDWPYNVRASDPRYCARYLQCDGKHYQPKTCPGGTFFNAGLGRCDSAEKVDCSGKLDNPRSPPRYTPPPPVVTPPPRTAPPLTYPPIVNS